LTQVQRLTALEQFRKGEVDVLLATDLAARGLDIDRLETVINFEMPSQVQTYVHRIGRTARAGRGGKSCTLIGEGRRHLMKEVIKDAEEKSMRDSGDGPSISSKSGIIRSRTIPAAVVAHFVAKINSLEPHVDEVLQAEAVARLDRLAEMEAMRAKNIIEHSDDIKSRPQREWFASGRQKQSTKEAVAEKQRMIAEKVGTGMHRMTRKKRRAREAKEDLMEALAEREENGMKAKKLVTDKSIKTAARAHKKKLELAEKEIGRKSVYDEDQERKASEKKREKEKKRKGPFSSDAIGDSSLFDDERVTHTKKAKAEEKRPSRYVYFARTLNGICMRLTASLFSYLRPHSYNFTGYDPSKPTTKGKKKSAHAFKSKSKHKRRK
jgi:ATP-dependent RNA helicase DDX27